MGWGWLKELLVGSKASADSVEPATTVESTQAEDSEPDAESHVVVKEARRVYRVEDALKLATEFARLVPGAEVDDFTSDDYVRRDGLRARVTYRHEGALVRLLVVQDRDDWSERYVWLDTKAPGTHGEFNLIRGDASDDVSDPLPEGEKRYFVGPSCWVSGERLYNEIARMLTLPRAMQQRLVELSKKVELVKLDQEVLGVRIAEFFDFDDRFHSEGGAQEILQLGAELVELATKFPPMSKDAALLAEARKCSYCGGYFVFSPENPTCTRCGAPAKNAGPIPPRPPDEVPDNPLTIEEREEDPEGFDEMMRKIRRRADTFAAKVTNPRVEEDPDRSRVFVEYTFEGREYRAKFMEELCGIRTHVPEIQGRFRLFYAEDDTRAQEDPDHVWRESERHIYFSKHGRVNSRRTTKEAARLASIPEETRAFIAGMCEKYGEFSGVELDRDGYLALGLGLAVVHPDGKGVSAALEGTRDLAKIVGGIPLGFREEAEVARFTLSHCTYCGASYFAEATKPACVCCGGLAPSTAVPQG